VLPQLKRPRILVIDDEADQRTALRLVLEADLYTVRVATAGDEAIAMLDASPYDLVIMDWRMPGLAGASLCRTIRSRANAPPVVVVSSADEAFESGEDIVAALRKPLDADELIAVIERQLST